MAAPHSGASVGGTWPRTRRARRSSSASSGGVEQRFLLKWSAHPTDFAPQRPDVLGSTLPERLLKDYNGTTVWLSANLNAFGWKSLPPWLKVAAGMGAEGMLTARNNPGGYR